MSAHLSSDRSSHRSSHRLIALPLLPVLVCLILAAAPTLAGSDEWKPVDPAHLALKAPMVEKDADAEVLLWEVNVEKKLEAAVLAHYLRIKIFSERGRDSHSKVELLFLNGSKIKDVAGRTIKPDGTIIDLRPEAILDQMLARAGKLKIQAKTFTLPGVEPGAIIEYRWIEEQKSSYYLRLYFQRDIPIQVVKYYIKSPGSQSNRLSMKLFNMEKRRSEENRKGFHNLTMRDVPAFRTEPYMPPENELRSWVLIHYTNAYSALGSWSNFGSYMYESIKPLIKVNDEVRKAAVEAIGDATAPEQKLERLFAFCRSRIRNLTDDASGLSADELAKLKTNKSPADTLRRAAGSDFDINLLFAGLATAAGFDARLALTADRSDIFFDRNLVIPLFLTGDGIAIQVGDDWRFFDPGSPHIPYGMLRWQEEGSDALIADPLDARFVRTPLSPPEKSQSRRKAALRLSEDGTLEGKVNIEMTGHIGAEMREAYDQYSDKEREKMVRESLTKQISTAEVSGIEIRNLTDSTKPLIFSYEVRVPGYAQRTGKRLFLQPALFQYGVKPLFSASERRHGVYFRHPWSEEDSVTIALPDGFELDNAEAPAPFKVADTSQYDVQLWFDKPRRSLIYQRSFFFGSNGNLLFPGRGSDVKVEEIYPKLKRVFDVIHARDNHTITLKQITPDPK